MLEKEKKKPTSRGHILYDSIYIMFSKCHLRAGEQSSDCQGLGVFGGNEVGVSVRRQHKGDLCGDGVVLCLDGSGGCMNLHV